MRPFMIVLSVALAGTPASSRPPSADAPAPVKLTRCLVSLIDEAEVPAQEAGVLVAINVREGQQVSKDDVLGQVDTKQAELDKYVAEKQLEVAQERAGNDVNRRYAKLAADVAEAEFEAALESNRISRGAVPQIEVNRLKLVWDKSGLQIQQALHDLKVFGLEEQVRQAELDAAKAQIARRQIRSPLDGQVVKLHGHVGEWVKPGDPAFHVVRMDRLRIEGFVNHLKYAPGVIDGRQVTVEVELSEGSREQLSGHIEIPSTMVEPGGDYRVWAEVDNRPQGQHWLLWPGQLADMTIHLDKPRNPQRPGRAITRSLPR